MTSKIRFLGDGAGGAYLQCYFSQLSIFSSPLTVETLPWSSKLPIRAQTSLLERPLGQLAYRTSTTCKKAIGFPSDKGIEKYDLLGPRARHKALWAGEVRPHANCFIFRPTLVGTAYYALADRIGPMLKRAKYKRHGDPQSLGDDE